MFVSFILRRVVKYRTYTLSRNKQIQVKAGISTYINKSRPLPPAGCGVCCGRRPGREQPPCQLHQPLGLCIGLLLLWYYHYHHR